MASSSSRTARLTLAALLALALALPASAGAATLEWPEASDIVASPDGRHVYAAGSNTLSFRVDQATGALSLIGHTEPGGYYQPAIAMARDGRFVYVASGRSTWQRNSISVFTRDAESGLLTLEEVFRGREDIGGVWSMAASADGTQLYVGQTTPNALHVLDVHPDTGALSFRQTLYAEELPAGQAYDIAPSADGRHVYLAGDYVGILARDPQTGLLAKAGTGYHHGTMWAVALSPDGLRVYGGMTHVDTWKRNPDSGALEFSSHDQRSGDCFGCDQGFFISPSPDGRAVFTSAEEHGTLVQWRVTDAGLAFERNYVDGQDGVRGIANPMGMAWSPDGRFAFVVASVHRTPQYTSSSGRYGSVAAFRRTEGGLEFAGAVGPGIPVEDDEGCPRGPQGFPRTTIEDGALYTNSPDITLTVFCAAGTGSVRLSNTAGDFSASRPIRITGGITRIPWRLDTTGMQRDVKRVHVRFTSNRDNRPDLFDDIVLDQRAPQLLTAAIQGSRLRLKARDNRSGVKRLQVTTSKKKPGKARRYSSKPKLSGSPRRVFVRVFDGAGNPSKWRVAQR
jgi:6-phosphogluconolactonase (cycloisomerase 2 family)